MADKKDDKAKTPDKGKEAAADEPKKSKKPLIFGGSAVGLLAVAFIMAQMAVPKKVVEPRLDGPFMIPLSSADITINLAGENSKRYLVMMLKAEYYTYDAHYVEARISGGGGDGHGGGAAEDPHYSAMLKHALLGIAATKKLGEVTDPLAVDAFLEQVREAVDPIVFPVAVGHAHSAKEVDPESGLRAGESIFDATLRGLLYEHRIHVDQTRGTIRLDDGPVIEFKGDEHDLRLVDQKGQDVYVDVSALKPAFRGEVHVGVPGRVRKVYRDKFLVQ